MNKWWLIFASLVLLFLMNTLYQSNYFNHYANFNVETCVAIAEIFAPEDIEKIDKENLIISSYVHDLSHNGALYNFDINKNELTQLTGDLDFPFYPHGIATSENNIFVVNHHPEGDRIEKFKKIETTLEHVSSFQDPQLHHANDIAPINSDQFFVTIDHGLESKLGQLVENFSRIGLGKVLFYDGKKFIPVLDHLSYANGIVVDVASNRLYVSEMIAKKVTVYDIKNPRSPLKISEILVEGFPDNLTLDIENRELWIATHLQILSLKKHSEDHENKTSPSQVVKVSLDSLEQKEVFLGTSLQFSAISVAYPVGDHIFLGSIFGKNLLRCNKP